MSVDLKVGIYFWSLINDVKVCYKVISVLQHHIKLDQGIWVPNEFKKNIVRWVCTKNNILMPRETILKGMQKFLKTQRWKCVYCNTINNGSDVKCQGKWYGNLPYPHTKYGSLPNNQQYFLWGGEKKGVVKFPPSISQFKYKEWKVDAQKKQLLDLYKNGVPCNAIRCIHNSHINKTFKGTPQIIVYPYPNGLSYMPGEMVGHIRTHNESICPRCFKHYPEYQIPFSVILYDKHRIRLENERNWWFVEVLFWIKHEILDKNKILTPLRCESLIHKMYTKIITKIDLPEYINTVFTKAPGKSDHPWYNATTHEISFGKTIQHFVNYLLQSAKNKGVTLNLTKIINETKTNQLKF